MNYQLSVKIGETNSTVFLKNGFETDKRPRDCIHNHSYTEFHALLGGNARFKVGDSVYEIKSGDVFAIPCNTLHTCVYCSPQVRHFAFQIDAPVQSFCSRHITEALLGSFFEHVSSLRSCDDCSKISAYISLICCDFYSENKLPATDINDVSYIIYEFFSTRYRENVTLSDLAKVLHFSDKHTERLVIRYTGMTFKQKLVSHRMSIAKHLRMTTDMSLTDIARYVGYNSYSGFWKNFRSL